MDFYGEVHILTVPYGPSNSMSTGEHLLCDTCIYGNLLALYVSSSGSVKLMTMPLYRVFLIFISFYFFSQLKP